MRKVLWHKYHKLSAKRQAREWGIPTDILEDVRTLYTLLDEQDRPSGLGPLTNMKPVNRNMPPLSDPSCVEAFRAKILQDLSLLNIHPCIANCTPSELEALRHLEEDRQVTIKPADKGGNIVVLDSADYKLMCSRILEDRETYEKLTMDPTSEYRDELHKILQEALTEGLIDKNEFKAMYPQFPVRQVFYCLPKVHKQTKPLKGRPIVAGIGGLTEQVGVYIDQILNPFVLSLPSYVRDTQDLLKKLEGIVLEDNTLLVSIDVESLYTSIRHDLGVEACRHFLSTRGIQFQSHTNFLLKLLRFTLTHNIFYFGQQIFHQLRGTAMGCSCAPSYANLLLGWWEATQVFVEPPSTFCHCVQLWYRFIDDIFILWSGTRAQFQEFINFLNSNILGLHFTYELSNDCLSFLDVLIRRGDDNNIVTTMYRKPTATNSYLAWNSHHPRTLKKSIPYGQYLRARRVCSELSDFKKVADDLRVRFRARGYPDGVLRNAYQRALGQNRSTLLSKVKRSPSEETKTIRFITTYSSGSEQIRDLLKNNWSILCSDPEIREVVCDVPQLTFRKGRSLRDHLVHSMYRTQAETKHFFPSVLGSFRCSGCVACPHIKISKQFTSTTTTRTYRIRDFINCRTEGVVYLATCICGSQYVGKTIREFRRRVGEHLRDIRLHLDTSVSRHVWENHGGKQCFSFQGIEKVRRHIRGGDWDRNILQRETFWIYSLGTESPRGLNEQLNFTSYIR